MERTAENTVIGFIGTGVMGKSMAGHLMSKGYKLHVYSRTKEKAESLVAQGASWHSSPAALAPLCDVIITMVGYPRDVEEVYLGDQGVIPFAKQGALVIDMTTSSPSLAKRIEEEASKRGIWALDAPVSGGDIGAREARLSIMAGGSKEAFEQAVPVLEAMGTQIVHQGPAGSGQFTKMCNQIAIASNMMGVCEALIYAEKAGLDPSTVLKSIQSGAAGSFSLSNLAPRVINGDYAPGFYVKHFIKDMQIALDSAKEMNLDLPGLSLALSLYERLARMGEEDSGTQALFKVYLQQQ
ncbi:2-hydroxy-3-oxopropionate reductase [Paenibacillus konkukensis]|uniref:2-hydroxy-3-oxopropionate reductase n=2 Tax=Paenibacillus konkukensis TaxID=2020716 RepID=A0ABY4RT89_9BACL|nr:NAD(P)-dependent oxidoreductase [Paenibacillus konkukensis]UQZ84748.1 2-hydroxy-3-oxopropionate reductase [Paenibacillus konkukensis]